MKDLRSYKGVGEKTEKLLLKLGLRTDEDLLRYYPREYEFYDPPSDPEKAEPEKLISVKASLLAPVKLLTGKNGQNLQADALCGKQKIHMIWFHATWLRGMLRQGEWYIFRGRLHRNGRYTSMEHPEVYTMSQYETVQGHLLPVYGLTKGLTGKLMIRLVRQVLEDLSDREFLSEDLRKRYDLIDETEAIRQIHFPDNREAYLKARSRLAFDEFYQFITAVRQLKERKGEIPACHSLKPVWTTYSLTEALPYRLTGAQQRVWSEIERDLNGYLRMTRLIQGDVGSGKTVLAFLAMVQAIENGCQAALMVPTEVLAIQHYEAFLRFCESVPSFSCKVALLTGSTPRSKRLQIYQGLSDGSLQAVIGTHALIQEKVRFHDLGLAIVDEQHRFGVEQRAALSEGERPPHLLVMSATPIPRTLAMILYADLDISALDEMPTGRLPIKNCCVRADHRPSAYRFIEKQVREGRQAYLICPMVEESEGIEAENVLDTARKLRTVLPEDISVGILHGRMKPAEKAGVMDAFSKGEIQVLVATTVVEVGVNVPNATVMMVENAERFGLAQLHQLRGRVGRGEHQSYCIFIQGSTDEETTGRLEILTKSNDGFTIASEDLRLRGPGDFFGTRQSGELYFHIADIYRDASILQQASEAASLCCKKNLEIVK